jgi:hypothetical protein
MPPSVLPIQCSDLPEVARFLHENQNSAIGTEAWIEALQPRWKIEQPNYGYMLVDSGALVGTLAAIYSDQTIDGRVERFCNLTSWCVLEPYRSHSMRLAMAIVNQKGYHFTNLTPLPIVEKSLAFLKFRPLEDHHDVIAAAAYAFVPSLARVYTSDAAILRHAPEAIQKVYLDHRGVKQLHHALIGRPAAWLYVAFRDIRVKGLPSALLMHASDPGLCTRYLPALCRALLLRHRMFALRADSRFFAVKPRLAVAQPFSPHTLFRSDTLSAAQVPNIYSELVTLPGTAG